MPVEDTLVHPHDLRCTTNAGFVLEDRPVEMRAFGGVHAGILTLQA
jgi:hypothetical protein